jgi:large subunit ribosomal protein L23
MRQDLVLQRPLITEKTMQLTAQDKFTFVVAKNASKHSIAETVEKQFKVNVIDVATSVIKGKLRKFGTKRVSKLLSDGKKAIIQLKKGQKIDLFEIKENK